MDYKLAEEGTLEIQLTVQGGPVEPIRLPGGAGERRAPVVPLPAGAGEAIGAGLFEIRAVGKGGKSIEFDLFGIGAGELARLKSFLVRKEKRACSLRLRRIFGGPNRTSTIAIEATALDAVLSAPA